MSGIEFIILWLSIQFRIESNAVDYSTKIVSRFQKYYKRSATVSEPNEFLQQWLLRMTRCLSDFARLMAGIFALMQTSEDYCGWKVRATRNPMVLYSMRIGKLPLRLELRF